MTKIYLVRHCEAMGNVKQIFQGTTDCDISDLGGRQLEYLRRRFADIELDAVYSSPLLRAKKTALAIIGKKSIELKTDNGLIELDGGVVEGMPFLEAFNSVPGLLDVWKNRPQDFAPPAGESMRSAYARIDRTAQKIIAENRGKAIAVSSHGGILRCLLCKFIKNDIEYLNDIPGLENTAVSLIELDDNGNVNVPVLNDISHLPQGLLNRKSRVAAYLTGDDK
ncbi:MAG: histidine phosphatase family protein [Clostridia bacterium]|nr:histidine phosphatase family protein [Clostridia bacterium]